MGGMRAFIKQYHNPNVAPLNMELINHYFDNDPVPFIIDSFKSLEILPNIKILGYTYESNERNIDINDFIRTRSSSSRNKTKYMYTEDTRVAMITVKIQITCDGEVKVIDKKLLIPVPDQDGYYTIKGTKYSMIYQLTDASTYTTRKNLVYKSLTGVSIGRKKVTIMTTEDKEYDAIAYILYMFGKPMDTFLLFFAKFGVSRTLTYFSVNGIIDFTPTCTEDTDRYIYVTISKKLYIRVVREIFEDSPYVQSMVAMISTIVTNRLIPENLDNKRFWVEKIGSRSITNSYNYYDKGLTTLLYFDRLLDEASKKILKVHGENKTNIYAIVRWMIQNYNENRKKDNMDLDNKRLRCNECMSVLLTQVLSERVNRIIRLGKKADMEQICGMFNFNGDIIISELHHSNLLRFDERVNDQDVWSKLKYTTKGPNSLGGKNDKNISIKFRGIHPSYIGKIDISVCGNSDPGTTGVLTPMCKTNGLYFGDKEEPQEFKYKFDKSKFERLDTKSTSDVYIDISNLGMNEYYDVLEGFENLNKTCQMKRVSKND